MIGPAIGLQVYGLSPTALWLGCAGLGVAAALIIARWGDVVSQRDVATSRPPVLEPVE